MTKAVLLLAPGFEEIEAITPIDLLRRAGIQVTTVSVAAGLEVTGAHEITVRADTMLDGWQDTCDVVVVPGGGGGSKAIAASRAAGELILRHAQAGKLVAAICAAPAVVLAPLGLLAGKQFTCFPGMETKLNSGSFSPDRVVSDGQLITSRGAGTAAEFALAIIAGLLGGTKANEIQNSILQR